MSKLKVLWVDDDWSGDNGNHLQVILENTQKKIEENLQSNAKIEWIKRDKVAEGIAELDEAKDIRLVIIDRLFTNSNNYNHQALFLKAKKRGIPYIIFTNNIESGFVRDDSLCLLETDKTNLGQEKIVKLISSFFNKPPFRILHLSDLHFDSTTDKMKEIRQDQMFDSLTKLLYNLSEEKPFDAVFATGDFAYHKPSNDMVFILKYLNKIINATVGLNNLERFFVIPGNHDLIWDNFGEKKLSETPWIHYLQFYLSIYNDLGSTYNLRAWDKENKTFNFKAISEELIWNRKIKESKLDIIGLATPSLDPNQQGKGFVSKKSLDFIKENWQSTNNDYFRISLLHHNIFPIFSLNPYDEKHTIINSEEVVSTLAKVKCDLVLTGHTHVANYGKLSFSNQNLRGFEPISNLIILSTGTAGGDTPGADRPRSFNLIEYLHYDEEKGTRNMIVTPYIYDSLDGEWKDLKPLNTTT